MVASLKSPEMARVPNTCILQTNLKLMPLHHFTHYFAIRKPSMTLGVLPIVRGSASPEAFMYGDASRSSYLASDLDHAWFSATQAWSKKQEARR